MRIHARIARILVYFFIGISSLFLKQGKADWCADQGIRCRLDSISRSIGSSAPIGLAVREFPQRFESYINAHCPGGANRNRAEASLICGEPALRGLLQDITFVGLPSAGRLLGLPQNGMRLIHDCAGAHLQISLDLIQTESGLATLMEILDGLIQKTILTGSMRLYSAITEAQNRPRCGGSYVPAVSYLFPVDRRNNRHFSSEGVTFFEIPRGAFGSVTSRNERELPRAAITSSCLGDDRPSGDSLRESTGSALLGSLRSTSIAPDRSTSSSATSRQAAEITASRGETFQSDSLTDYMTYMERLDEMEAEIQGNCTYTAPAGYESGSSQACERSMERYNRHSRSGRFSREDIGLHERDLAEMARNSRDERNVLNHEWRADRAQIALATSPPPGVSVEVTYENMTESSQAIVQRWFGRCTTSSAQICNCQSVLGELIEFLPQNRISEARTLIRAASCTPSR